LTQKLISTAGVIQNFSHLGSTRHLIQNNLKTPSNAILNDRVDNFNKN